MPTLIRKVLNLPEKQEQPVTPSRQNVEDAEAVARRELLERTWLAPDPADEADTEDTEASVKVARSSQSPAPMFTEVDESGWSTWLRRAGRGLVFLCIGLMALLGVRDILVGRPGASTTAPKASSQVALPTGQAQAVATRWATTYLTWDSSAANDDAQRQSELAQDTAPGVDLTDSWNGSGAQHVVSALPGQVSVTGTVGRVVVYAQVEPVAAPSSSPSPSSTSTPPPAKPSSKPQPKKSGKPSKAAASTDALHVEPAALAADSSPNTAANSKASWVSLSVPVAWDGQRVVVAGLPAFVGTSAPHAAPGIKETPSQDDNLTEQTQDTATAFFTAYGSGDTAAMQAATAPGAQITPLGGSVKFVSIQKWSVFQTLQQQGEAGPTKAAGTQSSPSQQRDAQAVVTWQIGSAQVMQVYDVRLAPLSGGGSSTWRVASVTASTYPVSN